MAARYVRIGQYPDYRDEIRGTLLEILASTANPGTYAAPEDVAGCTLEMGADGLWTGNLGTLTQAQADALVASGVMGNMKAGTPAQIDGVQYWWSGVGVGWVIGSSVQYQLAGFRTNPFGNASQYPLFDPAWKASQNGTSDVVIGFIGDSTTQGVRDSNKPNAFSYPWFFGNRMERELGIKTGYAGLTPTAINENKFWTVGAGWIGGTGIGAAKKAFIECIPGVSTASTWCAPELGIDWDIADVLIICSGGGGTFNAVATGGQTVVGSSQGSADYSYAKVTISAARVSKYNTITITPTNSSQHFWIVGVSVRNQSGKNVIINNQGVGGSTTTDWNSTISVLHGDDLNKFVGSVLTFVSLGINEADSDPSGYISRLQTLVTRIAAYSDVVVLTPFYVSPSSDNLTMIGYLKDYEEAILAQITGAKKVIPMFSLMQTRNIPFWGTSRAMNWHPTQAGYKLIADLLWDEMTH